MVDWLMIPIALRDDGRAPLGFFWSAFSVWVLWPGLGACVDLSGDAQLRSGEKGW